MFQPQSSRIKRKPVTGQRRRGTTSVEFALVAPIIFALFFGAIEIGNLNFLNNLANDTAYQVARESIVPGANFSDIEIDAENRLKSMGLNNPDVVTRTIDGGLIEAEVTIAVDQNLWVLGPFASGKSIVQKCQFTKEVQ